MTLEKSKVCPDAVSGELSREITGRSNRVSVVVRGVPDRHSRRGQWWIVRVSERDLPGTRRSPTTVNTKWTEDEGLKE